MKHHTNTMHTTPYDKIRHHITQYNTLRYNTTQYDTIRHSTIQDDTRRYKTIQDDPTQLYSFVIVNMSSTEVWCSDTSRAKGRFFFDEDDKHFNDTHVIAGVEKSPLASHPQLTVKRPTFTPSSPDSEEGTNPQMILATSNRGASSAFDRPMKSGMCTKA